MTIIVKALTERQRLERVLARQESTIKQALATYLSDTRSPAALREVRELLQQRNIPAVMNIVDEHVVALGNVIPQVFANAAKDTTDAITSGLSTANSRIAINFDPSDPTAAAAMRASKLQFIQGFSDSQKASVRTAIAEVFAEGGGVREAAAAFKDSIGLTDTQLAAVEKYRTLLENNSKGALQRELRDRRFDNTVAGAIESGEVLEQSQIDRMVDRYRDQMVRYRSENIARTEALRITSEAKQEATRQIMAQADIPDEQIKRTWHATKDKRTRDSHRSMNGMSVIGNDTPFISGLGNELLYPGDPDAPAEDVINCRCTLSVKVLTPEEAGLV